jgi:hypothetical protein
VYANPVGVFVQSPRAPTSRPPCSAAPAIRGGELFCGDGGPATWPVGSESAKAIALPFLAVTSTRSVWPRSSDETL